MRSLVDVLEMKMKLESIDGLIKSDTLGDTLDYLKTFYNLPFDTKEEAVAGLAGMLGMLDWLFSE
jgi:hypothetical protein